MLYHFTAAQAFFLLKVIVTNLVPGKTKSYQNCWGDANSSLSALQIRRRAIKNLLNVFVRVGSETDLEVNPSPDAAIKGPAG